MASRIPCSSIPSIKKGPAVKRCNEQNFASPEKRARISGQKNSNVMPCPLNRAPRAAAPRMRRSMSMSNVANQRHLSSRPRTSKENMGARLSNVTAGMLAKNSRNVSNIRTPVQNITNRVASNSAENGAVKKKRAPWDLKGRLQDMELLLKQRGQLITDCDSRIAALESEKSSISQNLEVKENFSKTAQEQINNLNTELSSLKSQKRELEDKVCELEKNILNLKSNIDELESNNSCLRQQNSNLRLTVEDISQSKIVLESEFKFTKNLLEERDKQIDSLTSLNLENQTKISQMAEEIMCGEMKRRQLHNLVQELKGNIRVCCRVRPFLGSEVNTSGDKFLIPHIQFIDEKSLEISKNLNLDANSLSGLRTVRKDGQEFSFDRVFSPLHSQADVFDEISQLVQSSLDGYNVCVFAYGQTGSGKTYTMEGVYEDDLREGMIPRTVRLIFQEVQDLKSKGWNYSVEASFLEIYNENVRDLLVTPQEAKNLVYDIKMVEGRKSEVFVTNLKIVPVENISSVYDLLAVAQRHRSVAATNMNERSSRSHSVFQLKLKGKNEKLGEVSEGTLNLVDLAGSERLKESKSEGIRLSETQNINSSLSNLTNVFMALSQKQSHVPYRNSKLTYLLQNAMGGNSKTLMFVNVSPLENCIGETLNSLRFAAKVNKCHVGTATKLVKKV